MQLILRAVGFALILGFAPSAYAINTAAGLAQYFQQSLQVDGNILTFSVGSESLQPNQNTPYGLADIWTVNSSASDVTRITTIFRLKAFQEAYVIEHSYSSVSNHIINLDTAFSVDQGSANLHRLYYGPADNTVYMLEDYMNIPAVAGYSKQGKLINGGVPLNYAWNASQGFSLGVLSAKPSTAELPLSVSNNSIYMGVSYTPQIALNQQTAFGGAQQYESPKVFFSVNTGDYYQALDQYSKLLEKVVNRPIQNTVVDQKFAQPYWKTWGLDPNASGAFSKNDIWDITEQLKALNIHWIMLDWGWFYAEGNWKVNPDVFSDENDLKTFIADLKEDGFMVGVWYQPLQADPTDGDFNSQLLPLAIRNADNSLFIDDDDLALLNPASATVQSKVSGHLNRFKTLGFEHIYLDSQMAQLAIPPDYSQASPLDSHHALPDIYTLIRDFGETNNIGIEICPDGRSQSIHNMPQTMTNIGDPKNDRQLRSEFKSLKAIQGSRAIVGTYVDPFEDNKVSGSFLNIIGIGGQLMTMFRTVNDLGLAKWQQWSSFNTQKKLVTASYQNVYDIGFDYPEAHLVIKGSTRFYSFFTQESALDICLQNQCGEYNLSLVEAGKPSYYSGSLVFKGLASGRAYKAITFPEGSVFNLTANSSGEAVLQNFSFTKEVLFEVKDVPTVLKPGTGHGKQSITPVYLLLL